MKNQSVILKFKNEISFNQDGKHVRDGLSGALITGQNLWTSCDERSSLERLTLREDGSYGNHTTFDLKEYLELPDCKDCEIDIEGLALESEKFLWLVGSHSLTRKKPKKKDTPEKQIERLSKVRGDANRNLLARIPILLDPETGDYKLSKTLKDSKHHILSASQLIPAQKGNQLLEVLSEDIHFKYFMNIPGKDNGFDIEGLAVHKHSVFIGIRGPVLRGWAVILEIETEDVADNYFKLKPDSSGRMYKKHFLHMEGMGIRDLRVLGDDLLILAGPTMDLDGTIAVYKWKNGTKQKDEAIVHRKELVRLFNVPHGSGETTGQDKAEGMALIDPEHVLIVFDTPTDARKPNESDIIADVYKL